jgi:hypothetical protein
MGNSGKATAHKQVLREEAEVRQAERDKRTPQEQIARLDRILGEGVGAKKERAKLLTEIGA